MLVYSFFSLNFNYTSDVKHPHPITPFYPFEYDDKVFHRICISILEFALTATIKFFNELPIQRISYNDRNISEYDGNNTGNNSINAWWHRVIIAAVLNLAQTHLTSISGTAMKNTKWRHHFKSNFYSSTIIPCIS